MQSEHCTCAPGSGSPGRGSCIFPRLPVDAPLILSTAFSTDYVDNLFDVSPDVNKLLRFTRATASSFMHSLPSGEELFIGYALVVNCEVTEDIRAQYACHCDTSACRRSMPGGRATTAWLRCAARWKDMDSADGQSFIARARHSADWDTGDVPMSGDDPHQPLAPLCHQRRLLGCFRHRPHCSRQQRTNAGFEVGFYPDEESSVPRPIAIRRSMLATRSELREAAVDHDFCACRERRVVACKEQCGLRDFDGLAEALERHLLLDS